MGAAMPASHCRAIADILACRTEARFGDDVEWIEHENYDVDPGRAAAFYARIRDYWPGLPDNSLVPDYAGIRPKLTGKGEAAVDFMIDAPKDHGAPGLVQLFGIESPGLTSALSLAQEDLQRLMSC
jgi:L-2-hydroxyglutarate oxidase LhgO